MSLATKGMPWSKMDELNSSKRPDVRANALRDRPQPNSSECLKEYYQTHKSGFYGKHHSEEAKQALSTKLRNNTNGERIQWSQQARETLSKIRVERGAGSPEYRREYQRQWRVLNIFHIEEYAGEYRANHHDKIKERGRKYRTEHKAQLDVHQKQSSLESRYVALTLYSGQSALWPRCVCCGEENLAFLTIDHINGGGTQHSKHCGRNIHAWLRLHGWPEGFRTLCYNCNCGRGVRGRIDTICPHWKVESNG